MPPMTYRCVVDAVVVEADRYAINREKKTSIYNLNLLFFVRFSIIYTINFIFFMFIRVVVIFVVVCEVADVACRQVHSQNLLKFAFDLLFFFVIVCVGRGRGGPARGGPGRARMFLFINHLFI